MKQALSDSKLIAKQTRRHIFLDQMDRVVLWAALVKVIAPYYPESHTSRPPFALKTILRIRFLQLWFTLSDPMMEEAFFDTPLYREFAQLQEFIRPPDESAILHFRHWLEKHKLASPILVAVNDVLIRRGLMLKVGTFGMVVDATWIAAPSLTRNQDGLRDPEMHSA